jgi:hypothetical protein
VFGKGAWVDLEIGSPAVKWRITAIKKEFWENKSAEIFDLYRCTGPSFML